MATKTPKTTLKPCRCSLFEVGFYGPDGSAESYTSTGTECARQTNRLFAQGHDAKLVGFLVRGQLAGQEIRKTEGGVAVTFPDAIAAASSISAALGTKAANMLRLAEKKAEARGKQAANEPEMTPARIKVGRWQYEALIDRQGRAHYATKQTGAKIAERGDYALA